MAKLLTYEEYNEKVKNLKNMSDVSSFAKSLIAPENEAMKLYLQIESMSLKLVV